MNKFCCTREYVLKFIASFLVVQCVRQCDWCSYNAVDYYSEGV